MALKTDRTITPETYISQTMKISREFQVIQSKYSKKIQKLNERYCKLYSQYKKGQVIDLPAGAKEGFDKFRIDKVIPRITPQEHDAVNITFELNGFFIDSTEAKPEVKGTIIPQPKMNEDEQAGKEAELRNN